MHNVKDMHSVLQTHPHSQNYTEGHSNMSTHTCTWSKTANQTWNTSSNDYHSQSHTCVHTHTHTYTHTHALLNTFLPMLHQHFNMTIRSIVVSTSHCRSEGLGFESHQSGGGFQPWLSPTQSWECYGPSGKAGTTQPSFITVALSSTEMDLHSIISYHPHRSPH